MTINLKNIVVGGVLFYVAQFIVGIATGMVIHEGILESYYMANASFWRPELVQDPPDMASLMPRWIGVGLAMALLLAAIYDNIRSAFDGGPVIKGIKYGVDRHGPDGRLVGRVQPAGRHLVLVGGGELRLLHRGWRRAGVVHRQMGRMTRCVLIRPKAKPGLCRALPC